MSSPTSVCLNEQLRSCSRDTLFTGSGHRSKINRSVPLNFRCATRAGKGKGTHDEGHFYVLSVACTLCGFIIT